MEVLIIFLIAIVALIIYGVYTSSKNEKYRAETIERRRRFVEEISPTAQIIVNNGTHLFFHRQ